MAKIKFIVVFMGLVSLEYLVSIYEAGEGLYWPMTNDGYMMALNVSADLPKAILSTLVAILLIPFPIAPHGPDLIAAKTLIIAYALFLWVDVVQLIIGGFCTFSWIEEGLFLGAIICIAYYYTKHQSKWQLLKARLKALFKW